MASLKSIVVFLSGTVAGIMLSASALGLAASARADNHGTTAFPDVPAKHAAASAVAKLKKAGIVTGYPDDTYQGSRPVTRYELAVVLARFAQYYDTSKQPIATSKANISTAPRWSDPSRQFLASNGYVPPISPLFANPGTAPVTADQFSDTLSSTIDRMIDRNLPPTLH
jgi:hypothetical protein